LAKIKIIERDNATGIRFSIDLSRYDMGWLKVYLTWCSRWLYWGIKL